MFNKMVIPTTSGGGLTKQTPTLPTDSQIHSATDANPYYINGNFSNIKILYVDGLYSTDSGYTYFGADIIDDLVLGQEYNVKVGYYSTNGTQIAGRHITVYADKIKIGSCIITRNGGSTWSTEYAGLAYAEIRHLYLYG